MKEKVAEIGLSDRLVSSTACGCRRQSYVRPVIERESLSQVIAGSEGSELDNAHPSVPTRPKVAGRGRF